MKKILIETCLSQGLILLRFRFVFYGFEIPFTFHKFHFCEEQLFTQEYVDNFVKTKMS